MPLSGRCGRTSRHTYPPYWQVFFGRVTTGAADDLRRVTQIVYQMVQVRGALSIPHLAP